MAEKNNFNLLSLLPSLVEYSREMLCCAPAATAAHLLQLLCKAASAKRLAERFAAIISGCIHASADVSVC
jgi:hypothetical protein